MEGRSKKDTPQSPTQYYLSELGLNLEWQNNLLQFGPSDQSGQEYINNLRTQESYDRNVAKDSIHDMPPLDLLRTEEELGRDATEKDNEKPSVQSKPPRRECESNCWAFSAMNVVLESLKDALPKVAHDSTSTSATSGPQVINRVIEVLKAYPETLRRIEELQKEVDQLRSDSLSKEQPQE